jgi:hypothetical protein
MGPMSGLPKTTDDSRRSRPRNTMQARPQAWRSQLGRRIAVLFTFAAVVPALVLAVFSYKEITVEIAALNQKNRFQFTKAGGLYFHGWLLEQARALVLLSELGDAQPAAKHASTGQLRKLPGSAGLGFSERQLELLAAGRIVIHTAPLSAHASRVQLFRQLNNAGGATLFAYDLTTTPDLGLVLPPQYHFCLRNEVQQ